MPWRFGGLRYAEEDVDVVCVPAATLVPIVVRLLKAECDVNVNSSLANTGNVDTPVSLGLANIRTPVVLRFIVQACLAASVGACW